MRTAKEIIQASKEFVGEHRGKSWLAVVSTLLITASIFFCTLMPWTPLLVKIAGGIICGLLYVRLFVIYHDYQHRAILTDSRLATVIMNALGVYLLAPANIWKRSHEHHHNNNSKLTMSGIGSYPTISKERYLTLTKKERALYLINRHPLTVIFGYLTLFIYWLNLKSFIQSPAKHPDSFLSLFLHTTVGGVIWYFFGFGAFMITWVTPFFVMSGMGAYLFYCQHNFPGAQFAENHDWTYVNAALSSTSYMTMNPVMQWFTANIGYHQVHHVNSRIPFYRLKEALAKLPELQNVSTTSWNPIEMIRCFRLKLWDPERGKMITLRQLRMATHEV